MGRQIQSYSTDLAYIAGFLDGDGSLMLQFKKSKERRIGFRVITTICFYQDSRHEKPLYWIKRKLKIGHISRRNDGMTELRVNGHKSVGEILLLLKPYLKFKKNQVRLLLKAIGLLKSNLSKFPFLSGKTLLKVAVISDEMAKENYFSSQRKYTAQFIAEHISKINLSP